MPNKPIAKVDVQLLSSVKVKVSPNVTIRDLYSSIISNKDLYTTDSNEYVQSLTGQTPEKDKSSNKKPVVPKFLVTPDSQGLPTVTLLGSAIIATPGTPNFDEFPASLENYDSKNANLTITTVGRNKTPGWFDYDSGSGSVVSAPRRGNIIADNAGVVIVDDGTRGRTTDICNTWKSKIEVQGSAENDFCGFRETIDGIVKYKKSETDVCISQFVLQVNQPFAVRIKMYSFSPELKQVWSSSGAGGFSQGASIVAPSTPNIQVAWGQGQVVLTFYKNDTITLSYGGIDSEVKPLPGTLKDTDEWSQYCIYPLGDSIYVYSGAISTEATIKKHYVSFKLPQSVYIPASNMQMIFNCSEGYFNFSPIIHPNSGQLTSPLFGDGYLADGTVIVPSYLGKNGVGARKSPITFPDINDSSKFFKYLSNYSIIYDINPQGNGAYTYDLTLKVPNETNQLGAQLQNLHTQITNNLNAQIQAVQSGSISLSTALSNAQAANASFTAAMSAGITNLGFKADTYINGIKGSYDSMAAFLFTPSLFYGDVDSSGTKPPPLLGDPNTHVPVDTHSPIVTVGVVNGYLEDKFNQMFGQPGDDPSTSISKNINKTAKKMQLRLANKNIYSPALFYTSITLTKSLTNVGLNPSPQIDDCDVMSVTVNEAVEASNATVVLNNRADCSTGATSGKYTYVQGSNNFTGIKPIQISLGTQTAQGGQSNPLNVVFTGYVHRRSYSRTSDNQSICTLECEGMEKKLKEQYAVNLPFFDGWCHLAAIYYLAREAGFADNEILLYENPATGGGAIPIRSLLVGDPDTLTGGCFEGHINDTPSGAGGLGGAYVHMTLPLAVLGQESPNYNFSMGTKLWDCLHRIREFSNFFLYCNNFGHLIYCPPAKAFQDSGVTFVEVDTVGNFNEIKRRLDVIYDTNELRNAVIVQGLTYMANKDAIFGGEWVPHVHVQKKPNFPNDIGDASFAPWLRYAFLRNPKFEIPALARLATNEIFRRVTRNRLTGDFSSWGNPSIFPYNLVTVQETLNETGINNVKCAIAAHALNVSSENFQLESSFSIESLDVGAANYDPNLPSSLRD